MSHLIETGLRSYERHNQQQHNRVAARLRDCVYAAWIACFSVLRNLPLFFSHRPRTPLRVLCVMAFDTAARLRSSWLSRQTKQTLIATVDLGACLNDFFDEGRFSRDEYRQTRRLLAHSSGVQGRRLLRAYRQQLRQQELSRPDFSAPQYLDRWRTSVITYREDVIRLSLATLAAIAWGGTLETARRDALRDMDLTILFRIVMLAQILDDLLDWSDDQRLRLPTFLTMHAPNGGDRRQLRQALRQTRSLADAYTRGFEILPDHLLLQRLALRAIRWLIEGVAIWRAVNAPTRRPPGESKVLAI